MATDQPPTFTGGRNIAMKVPPHVWEETVRFYRDTLGLPEIANPYDTGPESVGFEFGANRLWIDRVPTMSQTELWLQVTTDDPVAAAEHLRAAGVARCDEIEPLGTSSAYWVTSPASVVHLVSGPDAG